MLSVNGGVTLGSFECPAIRQLTGDVAGRSRMEELGVLRQRISEVEDRQGR